MIPYMSHIDVHDLSRSVTKLFYRKNFGKIAFIRKILVKYGQIFTLSDYKLLVMSEA